MSEKSSISWTNSTLNVVVGCTKVSPGCHNCYAARLNDTRLVANPKSVRFGVPFEQLTFHPERMKMLRKRAPRRIFVNSMSDLFHHDVPDAFISQTFGAMMDAPQHTYQVLTKRPERMRRWVRDYFGSAAPPHIWLGVSIESNDFAWRANMLRETPAMVRFLSLEPLLSPVEQVVLEGLSWIIVGGESGAGWRPMDLAWARDVRNRCRQLQIPFFFKQVATMRPRDEMIPADLRIREYPA